MRATQRANLSLSTEELRQNISRRATAGVIATAGSQGGQLALTLSYNAVLARLISPHDFGLVAMAMVVAGFLQVFKDAGLSTATIQRADITDAQVSNLFWINVAVGTVAMLGMAATAPLVARFFHQTELVAIAIALSFGFLLEALAVQHIAILNRQMRFTLLAVMELACTAAGFIIGTILAFNEWTYWSLIAATLSTSALRVASAWTLSRWLPRWPRRHTGTRPLLRFGADLTIVGVVYAVSRGFDSMLIGRYIGTNAVGLYSRATALLTRPLERLIAPIYTVIVPALSRLQAEPEPYRRAFLRVFEGVVIAAFFAAALLFPLADVVVRVVLGEKWSAAAPIFAALSLAFIYLPLATATSWLYTSQGRGRDLLVTACVGAVIMIAAFLAALPFGATGVAIAYSSSGLIAHLPVTFYMGGRTGPVKVRDLWSAVIAHTPIFIAILAVTTLARDWIEPTAAPFVRLALCGAAGAAAGIATLMASTRSRRAAQALVRQVNDLRGGYGNPRALFKTATS